MHLHRACYGKLINFTRNIILSIFCNFLLIVLQVNPRNKNCLKKGRKISRFASFSAEKNVCRRVVGYNRGRNFSTLSQAGQVVLERAKKERGVSTPLRLRTRLVHKSRSRGRSVRVILGGLKVSGVKEKETSSAESLETRKFRVGRPSVSRACFA